MPKRRAACAIKQFRGLIDAEAADSDAIQSFLEVNTQFMPVPVPVDQTIHLNTVVTGMSFGGETPAYVYLTRLAAEWRLTLVKLASAAHRIFASSGDSQCFTSKFLDEVGAIGDWKVRLGAQKEDLRERLAPLLVPQAMANNGLKTEFIVLIGRASELDSHEGRRRQLSDLEHRCGLRTIAYDTVIRQVESGYATPRSVLRPNCWGYRLQSVEGLPKQLFGHVMPKDLELSPEVERELRARFYDIDAWRQNYPLIFNEKWAVTSDTSLMEKSGLHAEAIGIINRYRQKLPK